MKVMHTRCAGLDVHQKTVVACVLVGEPGPEPEKDTRSFSTLTVGLLALAEWLREKGVTHVVMEATGVYWKPVWAVLEGQFELVLANAALVKALRGHKTDRKDAAWLAELLRHGLIRASFVPPVATQDLRELTRYRAQVSGDRSRVGNRIRKLLEGANVKLGSVVSDVMGMTGRNILEAIVEGETDPERLADLAVGSLRRKKGPLVQALQGKIREHHRQLLRLELAQWRFLQRLLEELDAAIAEELGPFEKAVGVCDSIPGINQIAARGIIAELGTDMTQFPSAAHVVSWGGLCPGNHESAGKRLSGGTRAGNPWLKRILCQSAWAAASTRESYFAAQFRRLSARRGKKRAILAVAGSLLTVIYTVLKTGQSYKELGADYFLQRDAEQHKRRHVRGLERLGYDVQLAARVA